MEDVRVQVRAEEIHAQLEAKNYLGLKKMLADLHAADIADLFEELDTEECVILFRLLNKDQAADVFSYLGNERQRHIVSAVHPELLRQIMDELYFDDKIDFLEEMPANFVGQVIAFSTPEERDLINRFLSFPDNSAGTLMTIEYVDLKKHMTVRQALNHIKETGMDKETIYTCYALDDTRHLEGIVSLRRLVLTDENTTVEDIMQQDFVHVEAYDDQEAVAELFKKYDLMAAPVVDAEGRMIGIITIDDIVDVIERENTEDFQRMAAMEPSDEKYLKTGVFRLARKRIVWLLVLMISGTFTGGIISHYEELLSMAVILTVSIPMLMDSGGNAGSQSSTLIIRGMALGEIELCDWPRVLWKELRVGLIAGAALAVVNLLRMALFGGTDIQVGLTVSLTLLCTVVGAKLVGGLLPLGAKALRLDPAIMAGPLITTIVDAFSLVIYFAIAGWLVI